MATVVSVERLADAERVVYDVETSAGTFATAGGVVLKNTDSIFCIFDVGLAPSAPGYMHAVFEVAERAAAAVTALFRPPVELEFEKLMKPFMLLSKKRYAYVPYAAPDAPGALEVKGLAMVRRDTCPFVRRVLRATVEAMMHRTLGAGVDAATAGVRELLTGAAPAAELVLSKSLRDGYATTPPHVALAERIRARSPHNYPRPGDRVRYVLVTAADGTSAKALRDGIEDPDFAAERRLAVDYEAYYKRQMAAPLAELFGVCAQGEAFAARVERIRREVHRDKSEQGFQRRFLPTRAQPTAIGDGASA